MPIEKPYQTRKVVIIGAGRVGSHVALCLMFRHLVNEIVFLDVNREAAEAPGHGPRGPCLGHGRLVHHPCW